MQESKDYCGRRSDAPPDMVSLTWPDAGADANRMETDVPQWVTAITLSQEVKNKASPDEKMVGWCGPKY